MNASGMLLHYKEEREERGIGRTGENKQVGSEAIPEVANGANSCSISS